MRDEDIHVGDVLRVRQWNDMLNEFGTDDEGRIKSYYGFSENSKCLCGRQFTVTEISKSTLGNLKYYGFIDSNSDDIYYFAPNELEYIDEEELFVADDEEIKLLFE